MTYPGAKTLISLAAAVLLSSLGLRGEAPAVSKMGPMKFLIGAWRGELPAQPDGQKMAVESKFDWTANHQGIRFESVWLIGDKRYPYTSGMYVWDPEKNRPIITYVDGEGTLTTGTVEISGDVYQHELHVVEAGGKAELVRATVHQVDETTYTNTIFIMKDGKWTKFAEVKYVKIP
jgi:hypothetical protein